MHFLQTLPGDLLDRVPEGLKEQAGQIVDEIEANPTLAAILIGVGVLTALLFVWGIVKQFFKAAIFAGLASAGAWYWYFNIR
jgi:hypothetical protein